MQLCMTIAFHLLINSYTDCSRSLGGWPSVLRSVHPALFLAPLSRLFVMSSPIQNSSLPPPASPYNLPVASRPTLVLDALGYERAIGSGLLDPSSEDNPAGAKVAIRDIAALRSRKLAVQAASLDVAKERNRHQASRLNRT